MYISLFLNKTKKKICSYKKTTYICNPKREQDQNGAVVQLVRISACHAGGRGFESRPHRSQKPQKNLRLFLFTPLQPPPTGEAKSQSSDKNIGLELTSPTRE